MKNMTMFHMPTDCGLFHTREELEAVGWTERGNVFERERERERERENNSSGCSPSTRPR